jgi:magnesium transporter
MDKLRYPPPGTAPATLIVPQEYQGQKPVIALIEYDAHFFEEHRIEKLSDLLPCLENDKINWININGLGDIEFFQQLALHFRIHPLALEDILNLGQRPKVDEYDRQLFIVLHMAYKKKGQEVLFGQVSILLSENMVITIQELSGDVFDPVRQRLRDGAGNARFMKADYLAYALIDAVTDQYFPIVDSLGASMEDFEQTLLEQPTRVRLNELHEFRRLVARIRGAVSPQRDALTRLMHDESGLIADRTKPFFRDCYDNTVGMLDILESFRDATRSFMDLYLSSISLRTNEIIRILTVISSIFIPLIFIAGIYGMNRGFLYAICLMLAVAIGMIVFFKHKKLL